MQTQAVQQAQQDAVLLLQHQQLAGCRGCTFRVLLGPSGAVEGVPTHCGFGRGFHVRPFGGCRGCA